MVDGVLLDIDGVLTVSWRALPGASHTIGSLRDRGVDFRLVTNTSSKSRRQIAEVLHDAGMSIDGSHVITAVSSAGRLLAEQYPGRKCFLVNEGDLTEDLGEVETVDVDHADDAGVVLLGGAGPAVGYAELNAVFGLAGQGVPILALHRNTRFQTEYGPQLDMGAFVIGLEAAAGIEITVVGKPAEAFYASALSDMGIEAARAVMVGDDIGSDVVGAQDCGITGVLVRTGKFRESDLNGDKGRPDHVIDSIADLPALLDRLGDAAR
ncbi:HAD-IIA family hydrolase [Nakamurella sp. GG22]